METHHFHILARTDATQIFYQEFHLLQTSYVGYKALEKKTSQLSGFKRINESFRICWIY